MQRTVTANGAYVQYKGVYCLSISYTHTQTHTYLDTQGHSCIGQREGGLQHAGISTWYWHLINIAECSSFLPLNAMLPSSASLPPLNNTVS